MIVSNVVFGQVAGRGDSLSTETLSVHADSSYTCSLDMLMLMMDRRREPATSVSFYSRPDLNLGLLSGYRVYRASTLECTLRGMGAGMTAGMAAGAFGMMTGTWNEREAWYIAGAAAAIGAIFGRAKADDPEWNIKIRWDPEKTRE
jgi:hypothetical protein